MITDQYFWMSLKCLDPEAIEAIEECPCMHSLTHMLLTAVVESMVIKQ